MRPTQANPRLLCIFQGLQMSLFPMAVITIFWQRQIGLSMTEIMVLQGCFGLAMALFEFPSGYLADRMGYRRTLVAASIAMVVGWSIYLVAASFLVVLLAEVVLGIAMSLISGADSALLYESLLESGQETEFSRWTGLLKFWGQFGEGSAALVAGLLYAVSPRLPFALEVLVWLVNLGIALLFVEPSRERPLLKAGLDQLIGLARVVRQSPALRDVAFLMIVLGMSSFVPVWIIQLYAVDAGVSEVLLGPIWAVANYSVAIAALFSSRLALRWGLFPILGLCIVLIGVGYLGLGTVTAVWGFAFYFLLTVMRGIFHPVLHHEEQRLVPSSDRAGLISLRSFVFRMVFFVLGPVVGISIDRLGYHPILLALGALFVLLGSLALHRLRASLRLHGALSQSP